MKEDLIQICQKYKDYIAEKNTYKADFFYKEAAISQQDKCVVVIQFGRVGETLWGLNAIENFCLENRQKHIVFLLEENMKPLIQKEYPFSIVYFDLKGSDFISCMEQLKSNSSLLINIGRNKKSKQFTNDIAKLYGCRVIGQTEQDGLITVYGNRYMLASSLQSTQRINMLCELELLQRKIGIENVRLEQRDCKIVLQENTKVFIAYSASDQLRTWGIENYIELSRILTEGYHFEVWFVGTKEELIELEAKALKQEYFVQTLKEEVFAEQIKAIKTGMLICNDSGWLHIAEELGVPSVCVSIATAPYITGARLSTTISVMKEIDCLPCYEMNCDSEMCKNIRVSDVLKAVEWIIMKKPINEVREGILYYVHEANDQNIYNVYGNVANNRLANNITFSVIQKCLCNEKDTITTAQFTAAVKKDNFLKEKLLERYTIISNMLEETKQVYRKIIRNYYKEAKEETSDYSLWINNLPFYCRAIFEFSLSFSNMLLEDSPENTDKFFLTTQSVISDIREIFDVILQERD